MAQAFLYGGSGGGGGTGLPPFVIAATSEEVDSTQIWIDSATMIPYVNLNGTWTPLGAVYK
jgi:hypothetical protein